jgi:hypothetical protein
MGCRARTNRFSVQERICLYGDNLGKPSYFRDVISVPVLHSLSGDLVAAVCSDISQTNPVHPHVKFPVRIRSCVDPEPYACIRMHHTHLYNFEPEADSNRFKPAYKCAV